MTTQITITRGGSSASAHVPCHSVSAPGVAVSASYVSGQSVTAQNVSAPPGTQVFTVPLHRDGRPSVVTTADGGVTLTVQGTYNNAHIHATHSGASSCSSTSHSNTTGTNTNTSACNNTENNTKADNQCLQTPVRSIGSNNSSSSANAALTSQSSSTRNTTATSRDVSVHSTPCVASNVVDSAKTSVQLCSYSNLQTSPIVAITPRPRAPTVTHNSAVPIMPTVTVPTVTRSVGVEPTVSTATAIAARAVAGPVATAAAQAEPVTFAINPTHVAFVAPCTKPDVAAVSAYSSSDASPSVASVPVQSVSASASTSAVDASDRDARDAHAQTQLSVLTQEYSTLAKFHQKVVSKLPRDVRKMWELRALLQQPPQSQPSVNTSLNASVNSSGCNAHEYRGLSKVEVKARILSEEYAKLVVWHKQMMTDALALV